MKTKILLLLSQALLLSCNSPATEAEKQDNHYPEASTGNLQEEATQPIAHAYATGENEEYLEWESIRINGKFPLATAVKNVEGLLGKADSVVSIDWGETCAGSYRSEDSRNAYFRGVAFEQFGDSLELQYVDFSKGQRVFLQSGKLRLNHATTLEEIEQHFPNAVKNMGKDDYHIDGKKTDAVRLPHSKELSDGQWILMFQAGRLIRVENWFPC